MTTLVSRLGLAMLAVGALGQADCALFAVSGAVGAIVACPELGDGGADPFTVKFSDDAAINADVAAFVAASRDLFNVAAEADKQAKRACLNIGRDLGLTQDEMMPPGESLVSTEGPCHVVARKITAIVRRGVRLELRVTPPRCTVEAGVEASCSARCGALDHCKASCKARAQLVARCDDPKITLTGDSANPQAAQLLKTLQVNLPTLARAELALARRALENVDTLVRVGAKLPTIVDKGGEKAAKCVSAAAGMTTVSATLLGTTVDASLSVTASVGGKG